MRSQIAIHTYATKGHFIGARHTALSIRGSVEEVIVGGGEVVFDFKNVEVTQSFVDELIGVLILVHSPAILDRLVFKDCSESVRAILEFVATDRCDQYIKMHTH